MTLEEIRTAIQEGKFGPSDVFAPTALTSDPFIKEHVEEKINNAKGYQIRKLQEAEAKTATLETEKKALQDELASSKTSVLKTRAKETFEAVLTERPKLKEDERLSKFVRKQFEKGFTPADEAKLKDDLNKFVDTQVSEYQDLFGETKGGKPEGGGSKGGGKPASGNSDADEREKDASLDELKKSDLFPKD